MTFSDKIRLAIRKDRRTITEIASESGIHVNTLSRFVCKKTGLSSKHMDRIIQTLGLRIYVKPPPPVKKRYNEI